jgi:hypothetical protein
MGDRERVSVSERELFIKKHENGAKVRLVDCIFQKMRDFLAENDYIAQLFLSKVFCI